MTATGTTDPRADLRARHGDSLRIGEDCDLAADLEIEIDQGATVTIGDRVSVRRGTTIQAHRGGHVVIGNDVAIGENVFISAMVGISIGDGVGISNMVDIHDHNHRERSHRNLTTSAELVPWASGFAGAPVIIEVGAVLSNKTSVTAGVRIGQNSLLAANSVANRSIAPNVVAAGTPARTVRSFDGPLQPTDSRQTLRFAWFGTSIMEHLEAYNTCVFNQADLPDVGSSVVVEAWRNRGYIARLHHDLQVAWPYLRFEFDNHGEGGATSRDIAQIVNDTTASHDYRVDAAFFGCGINDVWRRFQGRTTEAVSPDEFDTNYRTVVATLTDKARRVICIAETPFGWDHDLDVEPGVVNTELQQYNELAARVAAEAGAEFIDVWPAFTTAAAQLAAWSEPTRPAGSLWSDGVHLSDLGDALMLRTVGEHLDTTSTINALTTYDTIDRDTAQRTYAHLVYPDHRP